MNDLIDFFELLTFDKIMSNLEFSTENEQLTITKGNDAYLFYFSKVPSIFRSNLCKEILLITDENAHLKLELDSQLAEYLDLKSENKSIEKFIKSKKNEIPEDFLSQFEENLGTYRSFSYIYLTLKINNKYSEDKANIKKSKI